MDRQRAHGIGHISLCVRGLHIVKDPRSPALRDKFPAQNLDSRKHILKNSYESESSEKVRTRSSARYMFAVKISASAPCYRIGIRISTSLHEGCIAKKMKAHHLLAQEVLLQRPFPNRIVLQRNISIRRECTWQNGDVSEYRLEWFVEDIGHLVLKVLSRDCRTKSSTFRSSAVVRSRYQEMEI